MTELFFSSILKDTYYGELENLLFFNVHQQAFRSGIIQSVETYGTPTILRDGDRLRIKVGELSVVQSLFALESDRPDAQLLGIVLYYRESIEQLTILHIAIQSEYAVTGSQSEQLLALRLLQKVRESAAHIKGIQSVALLYGHSRLRQIPVHHRSQPVILSHSF
jgi:hypothetical protein